MAIKNTEDAGAIASSRSLDKVEVGLSPKDRDPAPNPEAFALDQFDPTPPQATPQPLFYPGPLWNKPGIAGDGDKKDGPEDNADAALAQNKVSNSTDGDTSTKEIRKKIAIRDLQFLSQRFDSPKLGIRNRLDSPFAKFLRGNIVIKEEGKEDRKIETFLDLVLTSPEKLEKLNFNKREIKDIQRELRELNKEGYRLGYKGEDLSVGMRIALGYEVEPLPEDLASILVLELLEAKEPHIKVLAYPAAVRGMLWQLVEDSQHDPNQDMHHWFTRMITLVRSGDTDFIFDFSEDGQDPLLSYFEGAYEDGRYGIRDGTWEFLFLLRSGLGVSYQEDFIRHLLNLNEGELATARNIMMDGIEGEFYAEIQELIMMDIPRPSYVTDNNASGWVYLQCTTGDVEDDYYTTNDILRGEIIHYAILGFLDTDNFIKSVEEEDYLRSLSLIREARVALAEYIDGNVVNLTRPYPEVTQDRINYLNHAAEVLHAIENKLNFRVGEGVSRQNLPSILSPQEQLRATLIPVKINRQIVKGTQNRLQYRETQKRREIFVGLKSQHNQWGEALKTKLQEYEYVPQELIETIETVDRLIAENPKLAKHSDDLYKLALSLRGYLEGVEEEVFEESTSKLSDRLKGHLDNERGISKEDEKLRAELPDVPRLLLETARLEIQANQSLTPEQFQDILLKAAKETTSPEILAESLLATLEFIASQIELPPRMLMLQRKLNELGNNLQNLKTSLHVQRSAYKVFLVLALQEELQHFKDEEFETLQKHLTLNEIEQRIFEAYRVSLQIEENGSLQDLRLEDLKVISFLNSIKTAVDPKRGAIEQRDAAKRHDEEIRDAKGKKGKKGQTGK